MTGYNHYTTCGCGWCVNNGRRSSTARDLRGQMAGLNAKALLREHKVRFAASCYVNPNARCPVCGEAVFFYANSHGSRVFFDHPGAPWPKHACTDRGRPKAEAISSAPPPERRAAGIMQELRSAAGVSGMLTSTAGLHGWELLLVQSASGRAGRHRLSAELLGMPGTMVGIEYLSERAIVDVGDYISMRGGLVSVLDRETMRELTFRVGERIKASAPLEASTKEPDRPTDEASGLLTGTAAASLKYDLTWLEFPHFHNDKVPLSELCDRLEPVVRQYARNGIRKPRDVANALNRDKHRTARGAIWTARLTRFLLALIFEVPKEQAAGTASVVPSAAGVAMTVDEMARQLARLGRIVKPRS